MAVNVQYSLEELGLDVNEINTDILLKGDDEKTEDANIRLLKKSSNISKGDKKVQVEEKSLTTNTKMIYM